MVSALNGSFAKPSDLTGFLTDTDLTAEKLSNKLGNTYLKDSDLTAAKLGATLDSRYASADSVSKTNLVSALNGSFAKPSDLTAAKLGATLDSRYAAASALSKANLVNTLGDAYITDSDLTATKLANKLGNTYTKSSDVNTLIASGLSNRGIISVKNGEETLNVLTPASLSGELSKNNVVTDSTLTTRLGNYATTDSLSSLSDRTTTLESNALTADNLSTKLSANDSAVKRAFSDAGFAQTNDIATTVNNTLNGTGEGSFSARLANAGVITSGNLNDSGIVTTSNIANNTNVRNALANATNASLSDLGLVNIDSETGAVTSNAITTRNLATSGIVTTSNIANSLPSTVITTNNLDNSTIKGALSNAGFAQTTDIATTVNNTLNGSGEGSFSARLANAGVITSGNLSNSGIVTTSNIANSLPSTVITTNNLDNTTVKNALSNAGFAKTADLSTAMSNAGFAKTSDVVSTANFATQLQSSLNNTNVKTALSSAGFATKDDTSSSVVTMADLSKLLNGGLIVDASGKVKLDSSTSNTNANAISSKLTTAKAKDSSIQTTNIRASSNIATSVANIAATAATANAAANNDVDLNQEKCNQTDYMFWNEYAQEGKGICEKCPDESSFYDPNGTTPASRCKCDEASKKIAYDESKQIYVCVEAGEENSCLTESGTYWNGKCNTCPEGTYFNDESMNNPSLPRCVCEDKSATFNETTGRCVAAGQTECGNKDMVWSSEKQSCVACPDTAPFDSNTKTCVCKESQLVFSATQMACIQCEPGEIELNGNCIAADQSTCQQNSRYFWHKDTNMCEICPDYAPYNATTNRCTCKDEGYTFNPAIAECVSDCPEGSHTDDNTKQCVCDDPSQNINYNEWSCK